MQLPETSHEANEKVTKKMLSTHYVIILDCLKKYGLLTFEEISNYACLEKHQIGRRLKEMEGLQLIYKPGSKKMTSTGRNAFQYAVTGMDVVVPALPERVKKETTTAADHANFLIAQADNTKKAVQKSLGQAEPIVKPNGKVPSKIFANQQNLFDNF